MPSMKKLGTAAASVLIADDQADVSEALRMLLKGEGYQVAIANSPRQFLARLEEEDFDLALIDLNYTRDTTSGQEGLVLLHRARALDATLPVVVMTAWGSVELAVEALRNGAKDFVQKPWDNPRLLTIVRTQIELSRALRQGQRLEAENRVLKEDGDQKLIGTSKAMQPVLQLIERVGPSDANVLVTGEHGTGKGVVAQRLHAVSARADKQFVQVNTGGFAEGVFESELFGHAKGAFTDAKTERMGRFEMADGGTLFLDEIANIPMKHQPKLLRAIETSEFERVGSSKTLRVNVRLISATNADLHVESLAGCFRQDLLFRLNTVEIHLPALRERREDITALAGHFLRRHALQYRRDITGFEESALQLMMNHPWPGNIRELSHSIERAVLLAQGSLIGPGDIGLQPVREKEPRLDEMGLEDVERILIQKALTRFDGNALKAAEVLGLSRSAFYRRLQKYGL